jgi:hypothetical protein
MTWATPTLAIIAAPPLSPSRKRGVLRTTHPLARVRGSLLKASHQVCHGRPGRAGVGQHPHTADTAVAHRGPKRRGVVR